MLKANKPAVGKLSAAQRPASNRDHSGALRIGLVGLGLAGASMVRAVVNHSTCVLAGAADKSPILRKRFADDFDCKVDADIGSLVERDDIDVVYIATPHQFHKDHVIMAAERGKHIIVEKPMALTVADCDAMIDAAKHYRVQLIVGHSHAFDPAITTMREIVASGRIGRLSMVVAVNYTNFLYRPRRPEELDSTRGGGILFNQVPHQVDIARSLADSSVVSIRAHAAVLDSSRPTEGQCAALLTFESGAIANLIYSGYDRFDSDELCEWVGENGQPKMPAHGAARRALSELADVVAERDARSESYGYGGDRRLSPKPGERWSQPHFGLVIVSCEKGDMRVSGDRILVYDDDGVSELALPQADGTSGRREVLDELCTALGNDKPALHDGRFGRDTVAVCVAIRDSAASGQEIALNNSARLP